MKKQLLHVSRVTRGGKFTRVSKATIDELEARVESKLRELVNVNVVSPVGGSVKKSPDVGRFFTRLGLLRVEEAMENYLVSEAQRIVNDTRTGATL